MLEVRSATRANFPSQYAFSLVRPPPPKTAAASAPWAACARRNAAVIRSSAASQPTGSSGPSLRSRISGVVRRSPGASNSAAVQPFWHRPPRLTGKSRVPIRSVPPAPCKDMPHCREQYGQWVGTAEAGIASTLRGPRYPDPSAALRRRNVCLSAGRSAQCVRCRGEGGGGQGGLGQRPGPAAAQADAAEGARAAERAFGGGQGEPEAERRLGHGGGREVGAAHLLAPGLLHGPRGHQPDAADLADDRGEDPGQAAGAADAVGRGQLRGLDLRVVDGERPERRAGGAERGPVRQRSRLHAQRGGAPFRRRGERQHGGDGAAQLRRQPEMAVGAERPGDVLGDPRPGKLAGDPPDDLADQEPVGHRVVAVGRARRPVRALLLQGPDDRRPGQQLRAGQRPVERGQPRLVGEQPPHGDGFLAGPAELGPVAGDGGVQVDDLPVGEHVRRDRDNALGYRHERLHGLPGIGPAGRRVRQARGEVRYRLAGVVHADGGADLPGAVRRSMAGGVSGEVFSEVSGTWSASCRGRRGGHPAATGFSGYGEGMEAAIRQRYRAAHDSITRLCARPPAGAELFARLSGLLREAVAFRTAGWLRLDPATLLPLPGLLLQASHDRAGKLIHNEYFEPDFVTFRDLARRPVPVQSLWQAPGGQPQLSIRYRTILAGLGYGDELRAVFRCSGTVWGAACLARAAGDPPFSREEVAFASRVCEPIARGLRLSHLMAGDGPADPAPPGLLILGDDGSVVSETSAARHWIAQLPADRAAGLDLPAAVLSAASQARAADLARPGSGAVTGRVRTADGRWLRLHAARMAPAGAGAGDGAAAGDGAGAGDGDGAGAGAGDGAGAGQTAVIIEPAGSAELSPLLLDRHGLTEREREITQLLLRGLPTAEIARRLFITRYTLSDHMKAIFAKLGVSSRPELTALLLDRARRSPGRRSPGRISRG